MNVYTKLVKFLAVIPFLFAYAFAQVAVNPISQPHQTFVDGSGSPCSGCSVYSYVAGTNTALATYTDSTGTSQNTNPIVLDAAGGANIWVGASSYKFILKDALGTTIWTVDNVNSNFLKVSGGTLSGPLTVPTIHVTNLIDNGSGGPPLIGTGTPSGNQAVSASIVCSDEPISAVLCYGAVGDNSTDNTSVFASMENSAAQSFYLPQGIFKISQSSLSKRYVGPGSIVLSSNSNVTRDGNGDPIYNPTTIGLDGLQSYWQSSGPISIVLIGDSLTSCYPGGLLTGTNYTSCWGWMLQRYFAGPGRIGQGGLLSGALAERLAANVIGSFTNGTHGPTGHSIILAASSSTYISGAYIKQIILTTYNGAGGGTLTISGAGGTWGTCNTATGSGEVKCGSIGSPLVSPDGANYPSQSITLTCSAAGPCEITNFIGATLPTVSGDTTFVQVAANGGFNTGNFNNSSVINSIAFNQVYVTPDLHSIAVVMLGTNSIYNPSVAESPATFQANLSGIVTKLKASGMAPIIMIPPQPAPSSTYHPVLSPFQTYHDIYLQVARQNESQVIDLSNLDLASGNLYGGDGLHPSAQGQAAMFDKILKEGFSRSYWVENVLNNSLTVNPSQTGSADDILINDFNGIKQGTIGALNTATGGFTSGAIVVEGNKDIYISAGYPSLAGKLNILNSRITTAVFDTNGLNLGSPSVSIIGPASNPVKMRGGTGATYDLDVRNAANSMSNFQVGDGGVIALPNSTVSTSASTGASTALPANPAGYLLLQINGTNYKIPYYNN